ncbi:hypothetical protein ACQRET_03220 [Streptomyces koyangensis]|uniref:hypothetical protein n=1 Tax=Streptomyces koyangensis TaxID=188770 RepID=UPI003D071B25
MEAETGIPAVDTVLVWGGAVSLTLGLVTIAWRGIRGGVRLGRRVDQFIDDWQGEVARAGVPARPGVMERMGGLEDRMGGVEADLQRIKHELYPNSGGSLRDAVDRANERLALLCPTVVPGGDARGDRCPAPRDTDQDNPGDGAAAPGDTSDLTSGDARDSAGDSHEGG